MINKIKIILIIIFLLATITLMYCKTTKKINLSENNLIKDNLYKYKITKDYESILAIKDDKNYIYVLSSKETEKDIKEYKLIKYDLELSNIEEEAIFNTKDIEPSIIIKDNYVNVVSSNNVNIYKFDKSLKLINKLEKDIDDHDLYGEYKEQPLLIKDNEIYIYDKLYDKVLASCNKATSIIYKDNSFIYFNNEELNISCIYNIDKKTTDYLNDSIIEPINNGYMLYNYKDNKIIIKKENEKKYYLNSKEETSNIKVNSEGTKLITYSDESKELKIYDLESNKIINKIKLNLSSEEFISLFILNDLAYVVVTNSISYDLYVWNYKENTLNESMISHSDSKNKIDSYELVTKIKDEFNVNVYIYDKGVRFFNDFYALPSYDDELIYDSLSKTYRILSNFNKEFYDEFYINDNNGIEVYLTDKVAPSDLNTQIKNPSAYSLVMNNTYIIALNINTNSYEKTLCHELMHTIENNMHDLYNNKKLKSEPFNKWNEYNPKDFKYNNSYVEESNDRYTISSKKDVYFIDSYSHTYPSEDRARIFEQYCKDESILDKYPKIKKKSEYLKNEIINVYPIIKDSKVFNKTS